MQAITETSLLLALLSLSEGELILILALLLILLGARKLPDLGQGLRRGMLEFRDASKRVADEIDDAASDAGQSVAGIYGKPAAQALTPENQVVELYDPAALQDKGQPRNGRWGAKRGVVKCWFWIRRFLRAMLGLSDRL